MRQVLLVGSVLLLAGCSKSQPAHKGKSASEWRPMVADSDANFCLFGRFEDRHAIWSDLVQHGVLIRETGPDGWLRVSIGTPAEMTAFRTALVEVLGAGEA